MKKTYGKILSDNDDKEDFCGMFAAIFLFSPASWPWQQQEGDIYDGSQF